MPRYFVTTMTVVEADTQPDAVQLMAQSIPFDPRFVDGPYCDAVEEPLESSPLKPRRLALVDQ